MDIPDTVAHCVSNAIGLGLGLGFSFSVSFSFSCTLSNDRGGTATIIELYSPLLDGAAGTIPLTSEHPPWVLLKTDMHHCLHAIPRIFQALTTCLSRQWRYMDRTELVETVTYASLSLFELQLGLTIIPLWLTVPGLFLLPVLCAEVGLIWMLVRLLNLQARQFHCPWEGTRDGEDEGGEDGSWMVVGGMVLSEHRLRTKTLPRLAGLFRNGMHIFLPYRLGFPLDVVSRLLQRTLQLPTPTSTAVYNHVRANCVRFQPRQMNILVHNTGALDVAWVLSRLCSDLTPVQLTDSFRVYTFGSAAPEMTMPLGWRTGQQGHKADREGSSHSSTISHYAFEDDPFAQIGALMGVRQRMAGRLIGEVRVIQGSRPSGSVLWLAGGGRFTLDEYLDALFPDGDPRAGVLGQVCRIEREVSEMRELSALAKAVREVSTTKGRRISWTVLGALADPASGCRNDRDELANAMAALVSLEEARRLGRSLEGMLGYEFNSLAALVRRGEASAGEGLGGAVG